MPAVLTLEQVQSITHAFDDFTTVEASSLPEYYKQIFPRICECGGEVILTVDSSDQYGFTQLQCCNPDCWIKMAHRFAYFAKTLGYKGFGAAGALNLYEHLHGGFQYPTFLSIFSETPMTIASINGDAYASAFAELKEDLATKPFQFKDAVAALGIPDMGKGSTIFDVVKSPATFMGYIVRNKIDELCDIANIHALKTRYYLQISRIDVVTLFTDVMKNVRSTPKNEVCIAITGSVSVEGKALTRSEFIWKCEGITDKNGNQAYKLVETKAASKLDYVIADHPSSSSKYQLGKSLNKLITADEFYAMLKSAMEVAASEREDTQHQS